MHAVFGIGREVALFTRAWIEILLRQADMHTALVALFTRAWIEMMKWYPMAQ